MTADEFIPSHVISVTLTMSPLIDTFPFTSSLCDGEVVAIPTLPPVVKILPSVLLLNVAANLLVATKVPVVWLVDVKLVIVALDKLTLPVLKFVATILILVWFVLKIAPVLT